MYLTGISRATTLLIGAVSLCVAGATACQTTGGSTAPAVEVPEVGGVQTGIAAGWEGEPPYPGFCVKAGDPNADGEAEWTLTRGYDAAGRVTDEVYDHQADGTFDSRFQYAYDADGHRTKEQKFVKGRRGATEVVTYSYESGHRTRIEFDPDADDHPERVITQTFDDEGRRVGRTLDYGGDGKVDGRWKYEYRGDKLVVERWDQNADGTVDEIRRYEYEDGALVAEKLDVGADGSFEKAIRYERDERGRVVKRIVDEGAEGQPDEIVHIEYASGDRRSEVRVDVNADGNIESTTSYEYDRHGHLLRELSDRDADGSVDAVIRYTYDCWRQ